MKLNKTFAVAKWEFLEKVKTKVFLISLILTPAIIFFFALAPTLFTSSEDTSPKAIGLLDVSGIYYGNMRAELDKYKLSDGQPNYLLINLNKENGSLNASKKEADSLVLSKRLAGYLLIKNAGTDSVKVEYRGRQTGNLKEINRFEKAFNESRIRYKLTVQGVDPELIDQLSTNVDISTIQIEKGGKESKSDFLTTFFSSFILIMLLVMMILSSGGMLIRSLVEEKSNRLIEILVSSCTPDELLAGKILGLSSVGLFQIFIWMLLGISLAGFSLIPLNFFTNFIPMLVFFILGFIFYTAIFVGIGSIVTTEQEAQQITSYLSMILLLPVVLTVPAIENPESFMVKVLTYIPFTTPSIMLLRLSVSQVSAFVVSVTIFIMLISIYITNYLAAKIFRIGILSYGKKPSIKELINWIKEK